MFNKKKFKKMKSFVKISKAITLVMCMMFGLVLFTGCPSEGADAREGYLGTWRLTERVIGAGEIDYYNVTIVKSSVSEKDVIMNNFFNVSSVALIMTVDGNSFTIPQQTFQLVGFSGSGRRDGNYIKFSVLANATGGITLNLDVDGNKM